MTEIILQSPPIQLSSFPSSLPISNNDEFHQQPGLINIHTVGEGEGYFGERKRREEGEELSVLAVWCTLFRKSLIACRSVERAIDVMEIGVPTNVRHVAHVTFDRFNGFLGLPVEFEPEVPRRPPSARSVFLSLFFIVLL